MRRLTLVALAAGGLLALAAATAGRAPGADAQTGQDRLVVFETFGRVN